MDKLLNLLGLAVNAGKVQFGTEMSRRAVVINKAKLIVVANDTSEKTKEEFKYRCTSLGIEYIEYSTKDEIAKATGKKTPKAVVAVTDTSFAGAIAKIYGGGDYDKA